MKLFIGFLRAVKNFIIRHPFISAMVIFALVFLFAVAGILFSMPPAAQYFAIFFAVFIAVLSFFTAITLLIEIEKLLALGINNEKIRKFFMFLQMPVLLFILFPGMVCFFNYIEGSGFSALQYFYSSNIKILFCSVLGIELFFCFSAAVVFAFKKESFKTVFKFFFAVLFVIVLALFISTAPFVVAG